jgi:hypothetical protein
MYATVYKATVHFVGPEFKPQKAIAQFLSTLLKLAWLLKQLHNFATN